MLDKGTNNFHIIDVAIPNDINIAKKMKNINKIVWNVGRECHVDSSADYCIRVNPIEIVLFP